jgi:adenosine deaminase
MTFIRTLSFFFGAVFFSAVQANVDSYFNQIKNDPDTLYTFFKSMPKGGELHYHLAGGPYPETMLLLASTGEYCLNRESFSISKNAISCDGVNTKDILNQPELYEQIIKDWSFKDFAPGKESGHDHFFNSFIKFLPIVFDNRPALLADIMQRAAQQNEHYLEVMDNPDNASSLAYGKLIKNITSYTQKRQLLLANKDFQNNINKTVTESDRVINEARKQLGCNVNPDSGACTVKIKILYFSLREQPLDNVFAQTLNAFEAVLRSNGTLVGVNLVQPEDGIISLRDYRKQMLIFQYLHKQYPTVHIALHAGELESGAVAQDALKFHIHDALYTGHAQRIGHGAAIAHENNAEQTLKYMADNLLAVEINLISNLKILNLSGPAHPLNYYLSHQVPVVLSTDDEGILRTDLTSQFVKATQDHGLEYQILKRINRNTLTYSFLPGKSIWANSNSSELVSVCQDLNSRTCMDYIEGNEKAKIQWDLEQKLILFENKYINTKITK